MKVCAGYYGRRSSLGNSVQHRPRHHSHAHREVHMVDLWSPTEERFATNIRAAWNGRSSSPPSRKSTLSSTHMLAENNNMAELLSPIEERFATNIRAAWKREEFVTAVKEVYARGSERPPMARIRTGSAMRPFSALPSSMQKSSFKQVSSLASDWRPSYQCLRPI